MNARVKRHLRVEDVRLDADVEPSGGIRTYPRENPRDGLVIQCELFHPTSVDGRTVLLRLSERDRDDLLRVLRDEAVRARRAPS